MKIHINTARAIESLNMMVLKSCANAYYRETFAESLWSYTSPNVKADDDGKSDILCVNDI
jgi:hypothetical protein